LIPDPLGFSSKPKLNFSFDNATMILSLSGDSMRLEDQFWEGSSMINIYIDCKMIRGMIEPDENEQNADTLCVGKAETREQTLKEFSVSDGSKIKYENTCFESHKDFDYLYFLVPSEDLTDPKSERIEIYLAAKIMLLFYEDKSLVVETWLENMLSEDERTVSLQKAFLSLLSLLNTRYLVYFDQIEDKITDLEDTLANEEDKDYVSEISVLRKQLLTLRRYYESMLAVMEDLEENRNGLLNDDDLRLLHFQTQKAERLYHNTLNLRDYLTQVREAYQALLDIEANKVMKLFTVITSIFLPLTLLVGWYGMNLMMPEITFRYAYPVVILVSVTIVVGLIIYFKRNRWF
jgi:magnesium transporter